MFIFDIHGGGGRVATVSVVEVVMQLKNENQSSQMGSYDSFISPVT